MGYDEPSSKRHATEYEAEPLAKPKKSRVRLILLGLLALGIGGYLAANPDAWQQISSLAGGVQQQAGGGRGAARGAGGPPPVHVATAETRDVPVVVHTIGNVLANSVVTIKSQVDGPLLSAGFKEGQMVKQGDLLFRIDPAPFEAAMRQSQAQMARDQAQLQSAQADSDRAVMLADRGIVSAQQRDQLVANAKALAATIEADKAALERAQLNLGYTTIRSPVNGKTGPYIVYPGNQVHANDATGLITITEIQPVKISFNLPQGNLPLLQARMREGDLIANVAIRSDVAINPTGEEGDDRSFPVKVDFITNAVDQRTGTVELRATFENPDFRLVPGELVDVTVRLDTLKQVATVPREAVNIGQNGNYVFVVGDDMKAQMRPVNVLFQDQTISALGSGVKAGETVIIDGQLRVNPGASVLVTRPEGEAPANASPQAAGEPQAAGRQGGGRTGG
jgi:multidrug efflux system membrane fusion protein